MKIARSLPLVILGVGLFAVSSLLAANWPQWRGPQRDGISPETGLLQEWPAEGPPQLWRVDNVGGGYSTPSVVGDRFYVMGNEGDDNEFVQARNVSDGSVMWTRRIGNVGKPDQDPPYPGSRSTPTVDEDRIYALGSDGDLVCLDRASGEVRWHKNLLREFQGDSGTWAYSESPLVDGDAVVCTPGGEVATFVKLNKQTGETIWTSPIPNAGRAGYASAVISHAGGVKQYVQFLGDGLMGVNADTGEFLWRYDRTAQGPASIPTPIVDGDYIYTSAHASGGAALVKLSVDGGQFTAEEVYFNPKLPTAIGGAVLVGEYLYGTSGPTTVCAELRSGEIQWTEPRGIAPASICYADGRLYLHSEAGDVALIEASPEAYRERGRFTPSEAPDRGRSKAWAYPVVADGRLYIRDMNVLWCYDVSDRSRGE